MLILISDPAQVCSEVQLFAYRLRDTGMRDSAFPLAHHTTHHVLLSSAYVACATRCDLHSRLVCFGSDLSSKRLCRMSPIVFTHLTHVATMSNRRAKGIEQVASALSLQVSQRFVQPLKATVVTPQLCCGVCMGRLQTSATCFSTRRTAQG